MNTSSDFRQWLHAMKMVARLPGGTPPEFRRKLWLALADRHLHTTGIDWHKEESKCLSDDTWLDDDEELGIQIVKDLHRTGSSLFSGPNGNINQAKLKRVLLGYARWNPEVGYCQGFNMLGALILQVMDKNEIEALKVMIYLVEGVLPKGYFSGSLGGLQVDMIVFREILSNRLPKLSKHLQKIQNISGEGAFEPPLTNVFTMQWFLTLFCTCLPKNCVLRVWDLILIEGSDILLRTALAIWGLLEERILMEKTADEFYCKMGTLSGELLNGHLFDSNGLIQKVVDLGPINELQRMREKHLHNITPWKDQKNLRVIYTDEDGDSDEDSWRFMANARRASLGLSLMHRSQPSANEGRDRIALDISLLKKQYAKLRERQKQAHIILSNAARQTVNPGMNNTSQLSVNKYLAGRNAIVSNKGKRIGPPAGSIPPIRNATTITNTNTMVPALVKPSKNAAKPPKRIRSSSMDEPTDNEKHSKSTTNHSNEQQSSTVLHQRLQRTASSASSISDGASTSATQAPPPRHRLRRESSSYSEDDSDHEMLDDNSDDSSSSTSTSLCDDVDEPCVSSSVDASPLKKRPSTSASNYGALSDDSASSMSNLTERIDQLKQNQDAIVDDICSQPTISIDVVHDHNDDVEQTEEPDIHPMSTDADDDYVPPHDGSVQIDDSVCGNVPQISANLNTYEKELLEEALNLPQQITSTSQLSPIADIAEYLRYSCISPLKSPVSLLYLGFDQDSDEQNYSGQLGAEQAEQSEQSFKVDEDGVTNEYFERVNQVPAEYGVMEADETAAEIAPHVIAESDSLYSDKAFKMSEPCLEDDGGTSQQASNIFMKWEIENKHTPSDYECDSNEQIISCDDNDELKEATVESSIDMTTTTNDSEPTDDSSPPEESTENPDSNKNTEKVLQMIAENSVILHRIMNHDEREEDVRNVNEIIDNQSNVLIGEQFVQNDAMASIDSKFIADRISAMYSSVSRVLGKWNEYDVDDESRNKNVPVNMDMLEWHRDHFMNDDMPDCDEVLSIEQNDSPTKSIDHIVNSDSDYTVRNVSVNSDIMDKEDTVREIDDYLCEIVKSSDVQEPVVTHDHNSANFDDGNLVMNELEEVELSPIRKPESRFTKYINDVAAGLVFDDDPMPSIYHSDSMSTGINHNTAAISEPESVNLPDIGTYLSGSVETAPSSIENAFKFIDTFSAGNRNPSDDSRDRDKQLEILIRAAENIDRAKGISSERSRPVSLIDTTSAPRDIKPLSSVESSERNERYLSLPRCSRDRWRDPSPRRRIKQDADFVEYESRARRDKSPSVDPTPLYSSYSNIRFKDDTHEYKYDTDINPSSSSPQSFGSSSNSYCSSKNVEIRPVTLTFYDRFLSQKRERRIRMDKSPSSPVITKAYLDSLKPDYRDSYSRKDRNTRSAENSPSRKKNSFHFESTIDQSVTSQSESTMSNYPVYSQYPAADKYTKSCDNIPFNIDNRNNKSYKFDYSNSSEYSKTDVTQTKYTPMTQSLSMRTKSPSEWEKKFGLYGADGTSNT